MTFDNFANEIVSSLQKEFGGLEFSREYLEKLMGMSYNGLRVKEKDSDVAMVINLDDAYQRMQEGKTLESILSGTRENIMTAKFPFDGKIAALADYEHMKEKLILQIVPVKGNEQMLSKVPCRLINDLAVVYRFMLSMDEEEEASILVTMEYLESYGVSPKQLENDAALVCMRNHPLSLQPMETILFGTPEEEVTEPGLWCVGNDIGRYGAAVIAYPGTLDQIAERIGTGFYLIPSSIHEMIAMPDTMQMKASHIDSMVESVNSSEVKPEERLTNHGYHYDSEAKVFESGAAYEKRKEKEEEERNNPVQQEESDWEKKKHRVLLVEPGKSPKVVHMSMELESLQKAVGGDIEIVYPFQNEDSVGVICNEEGKIRGMEPNRALYDEDGFISDVLVGTFIVFGLHFEGLGYLDDRELRKFEARFYLPESFVYRNHQYYRIPRCVEEEEAC